MNRLLVSTLAMALAAMSATASAQTYQNKFQPSPDRYGQNYGTQYDYARVIRVDPVFDSRSGYGNGGYSGANSYNGSNHGNSRYSNSGYGDPRYGQNCQDSQSVVYGQDRYTNGYYRNDGYNRNDGYYDQYGQRNSGSQVGGTVATVIGGLLGAAIGSQVGGGSARYATSAIGSMVGGIAGRQIYEQGQRQRDPNRMGTVRVCDPVPVDDRYSGNYAGGYQGNYSGNYQTAYPGSSYQTSDRGVTAYNVTYEYAGRRYTTRTNYHPGNRIRIRVDVRPD